MGMELAEKILGNNGKVLLVKRNIVANKEALIDANSKVVIEKDIDTNEEKVVKQDCKINKLLDSLYLYVLNKGYSIQGVYE